MSRKNQGRRRRARPEKGLGAQAWRRITAEPDRLEKPPADTNNAEASRGNSMLSRRVTMLTQEARVWMND